MPISERRSFLWVCDRCGDKADFPDAITAKEQYGWVVIDVGCSLADPTDMTINKSEQVLCPACLRSLREWFRNTCPGGC